MPTRHGEHVELLSPFRDIRDELEAAALEADQAIRPTATYRSRGIARLAVATVAAWMLAMTGLAISSACREQSSLKAAMPTKRPSGLLERVETPRPGPRAQTFYMYRAQSAADYPMENINTADLAGVLWYLHNEVVSSTPRKYKIDRIRRYKVTVQNTWEFWNVHKRQFGAFVAYDAGRCTTPVCEDIYHQYGFIVGCQVVDTGVASYYSNTQTNWNCKEGEDQCNAPVWYSLPGPCPSMGMTNSHIKPNTVDLDVNEDKSAECMRRMPGGHCASATGAPDCTYSYEEAGEIMLDELVGIPAYNYFWNASYVKCEDERARHERDSPCFHNKEYDPETDQGVGTEFWNGKLDKDRCAYRLAQATHLFKTRFPDMPAELEPPPCEFDMYYEDEFTWKVNHSNAVQSAWWDNRMEVMKSE